MWAALSLTDFSRFSSGWFQGFKARNLIALRAPTTQAQKMPEDCREQGLEYLQFLRRASVPRPGEKSSAIGWYQRDQIANMDQIPLPFANTANEKTYSRRGRPSIRKKTAQGESKSWSRRQATLVLVICADGVPQYKPFLIYKGDSSRKYMAKEMMEYHPDVTVIWNAKAYSNEKVILD